MLLATIQQRIQQRMHQTQQAAMHQRIAKTRQITAQTADNIWGGLRAASFSVYVTIIVVY